MNGHLAVVGLLKRATGLTALVGQRISPDVMPDSPTLPAITYQKMSGSSARGAVADPPLMTAIFQISSWAKTRNDAAAIVQQVRAAMDRQRQQTVGGVYVDDTFYTDDVDMYDPPTKTYFNHCTFRIHYRDPA
ncbi:DUF3168 domain-containing protein [Duganella sp. BJB476]|uniref:tail completion protein gp17 n=1 Tax=Duganella sp. BJB476 TaxID=1871176 RepID=UPI000E344AE1|nr:DUF3168 domain-containing protein [Duganella sp. BJB476]RFP32419.1 DUF3168 domain-containing protein [Duganella sp. BJB476]